MRSLLIICFLLLSFIVSSCGSGGDGNQDELQRPATGPGSSEMASTNIESMELAKEILYAAHAGIGYGAANDPEDNEMLYNLMFYNLNSMAGHLGVKAIDPPKVLNLNYILNMFSPTSQSDIVLPYRESGVNVELLLKGSIIFSPFEVIVSSRSTLDFTTEGSYTYNDWQWLGQNNQVEVEMTTVGNITGYQNPDDTTQGAIADIKSITINAFDTLSSKLNTTDIRYNEWHISYQADVNATDPDTETKNMYILPLTGDYSSPDENPDHLDNRDYTVSGSFLINGHEYAYREGFQYTQHSEQVGVDEEENPIIKISISIEGALSIPKKDGFVVISSSDIHPIVRDSKGIWQSGMLYISGNKDFAEIEFEAGAATIYYGSESKKVEAWQTTLRPVL